MLLGFILIWRSPWADLVLQVRVVHWCDTRDPQR